MRWYLLIDIWISASHSLHLSNNSFVSFFAIVVGALNALTIDSYVRKLIAYTRMEKCSEDASHTKHKFQNLFRKRNCFLKLFPRKLFETFAQAPLFRKLSAVTVLKNARISFAIDFCFYWTYTLSFSVVCLSPIFQRWIIIQIVIYICNYVVIHTRT